MRKSTPISFRFGLALLVLGVLGVAPLLIGGSSHAGDEARISEVCLDCHEGMVEGFAWSPHRMDEDALDGPDAKIACTDCHAGDARHWEDDPEEYPMTNPADLDPTKSALACSGCHMNSHQQNHLEKNIHATADVNCSSCHKVHDNKSLGLLVQEQPGLCYECHQSVEGQFALPYRHPVADGVVKCTECHAKLDKTTTELSYNGTNWPCYNCHPQFEGPFPYEHQATLDYSTEEGGCLSCHAPHGAYLPRMLKQPYEFPHYQLCSQCHAVPLHNNNIQHGDAFAGVPCNDCHVDIHGSYSNRNFLSEALEGEGCFNPGCHQF